MSLISQITSSFNSSVHSSFYIKVDKTQIYVRGFEDASWIRCSTCFEVNTDKEYQIVRLFDSNSHNAEIKLFPASGLTKVVSPFNHPRLIYHNFEYAEIFIRFLIKPLKQRWWKTTNCIIFQLGYNPEGGFTDIESRALADSLGHCGAKQCFIVNPSYNLTEKQIEELYLEINSSRIKKVNKLSREFQKKLSWPFTQ